MEQEVPAPPLSEIVIVVAKYIQSATLSATQISDNGVCSNSTSAHVIYSHPNVRWPGRSVAPWVDVLDVSRMLTTRKLQLLSILARSKTPGKDSMKACQQSHQGLQQMDVW